MRTLMLASAAALTLTALPAALSAQDGGPEASAAAEFTMTAQQRAMYDSWDAARRAAYEAMEAAQQEYFWTLTPEQREAWWVLTPAQRVQVYNMAPAARANALVSLANQARAGANASATSVAARTGGEVPAPRTAAQANARATPPPASTTVTTTPSGQAVVTTNIPGNLTPPPASAMNKTYPVCTRRLQDNCQNPGEGGAPGKSRALGYWPGEPASERRRGRGG